MTAAPAFVGSPGGETARMRAELLSGFVDGLNYSGITYCLLSGFESYPESSGGDLDFMILPGDAGRLASLLDAVARRCRARLVQAIQHETGAWHCILAKLEGDEVSYFGPDCTTDYRRDGRLWLRAEHLLARRRWCGSFYVAARPDEFLYYLVKKVLKQEANRAHLRRLRVLYAACPDECGDGMGRFWSRAHVCAVTTAVLRSDESAMRSLLAPLLNELLASTEAEGWVARLSQQGRELQRRRQRMMNQTGFGVVVWGGDEPQRSQLANALQEKLRPAFRKTLLCSQTRKAIGPSGWLERVHSTLIIATAGSRPASLPEHNLNFCQVDASEHDATSAASKVLERMAERVDRRRHPEP